MFGVYCTCKLCTAGVVLHTRFFPLKWSQLFYHNVIRCNPIPIISGHMCKVGVLRGQPMGKETPNHLLGLCQLIMLWKSAWFNGGWRGVKSCKNFKWSPASVSQGSNLCSSTNNYFSSQAMALSLWFLLNEITKQPVCESFYIDTPRSLVMCEHSDCHITNRFLALDSNQSHTHIHNAMMDR